MRTRKQSPWGKFSYAGIIRIRFQGSEILSVSAAMQHPFEIEPILTGERDIVKHLPFIGAIKGDNDYEQR